MHRSVRRTIASLFGSLGVAVSRDTWWERVKRRRWEKLNSFSTHLFRRPERKLDRNVNTYRTQRTKFTRPARGSTNTRISASRVLEKRIHHYGLGMCFKGLGGAIRSRLDTQRTKKKHTNPGPTNFRAFEGVQYV